MVESESKYINPFVDWSFKYLFGKESVKDILIGFLNAVMQGEYRIMDIHYLNNEHQRENVNGKTIIYDLLCETDRGEYVIVEMQNKEKANFTDRALYYTSRAIAEQGEKGTWNYNLKAVYGIFFLNFELTQNEKKINSRTEVALVDVETGRVFNHKMKQIFIELPRFNKTEQECVSDYDQWIYILKNMETMTTMPFMDRNEVFAQLEQRAATARLSKEDRVEYEAELKTFRDYYCEVDFAKEKGFAEGRAEGREQGRAEGRAEGVYAVAKNLKQMGMTIEQISQATGLTIEEIEKA